MFKSLRDVSRHMALAGAFVIALNSPICAQTLSPLPVPTRGTETAPSFYPGPSTAIPADAATIDSEIDAFFTSAAPPPGVLPDSRHCSNYTVGRGVCRLTNYVDGVGWKCGIDDDTEVNKCTIGETPIPGPGCVGFGNPCSLLEHMPRPLWQEYAAKKIPCSCISGYASGYSDKGGYYCDANKRCATAAPATH